MKNKIIWIILAALALPALWCGWKCIGFFGASQGGWVVSIAANQVESPAFLKMVSASVSTKAEDRIYGREAQIRHAGFGEDDINKAIELIRMDHQVTRTGKDFEKLLATFERYREAAWSRGSVERWADDVCIKGARFKKGKDTWSEPFVMVDVPDFPDINPAMFIDPRGKLWLTWYTVIANQWSTSLLKYRISENYMQDNGPPEWPWNDAIHVKPGDPEERGILPNDRFVKSVERKVEEYAGYLAEQGASEKLLERWKRGGDNMLSKARGEDMILDGGPPPNLMHISVSKDKGMSWSMVKDSELPNPGSGADMVTLANGLWVTAYNDGIINRGRQNLAISISANEGQSWDITRHLEVETRTDTIMVEGSYPSIIQGEDGSLHVI